MSAKGQLRITVYVILFYFLLFCYLLGLGACSPKAIGQSSESKDSVYIEMLKKEELPSIDFQVGESFSVPELDFEIRRVSETEYIVKRPVRTEIRTEIFGKSEKTVIRNSYNSDTEIRNSDKSRTDNRTDNRTKNKIRNSDKSKTIDKNSEKTKIDQSKKQRSGFPNWVLALIAVLLIGAGFARWYFKGLRKP